MIMKVMFKYDNKIILLKYGFLLIFLLVIYVLFIFMVGTPTNYGVNGPLVYDIVLFAFMLFPVVAILLWIIDMLNTKIYIRDDGITYQSLTKKIYCKWIDILKVESTCYHFGDISNRDNCKDLKVTLNNKRPIKILYFLIKEGDKNNEYVADQLRELIEKNITNK